MAHIAKERVGDPAALSNSRAGQVKWRGNFQGTKLLLTDQVLCYFTLRVRVGKDKVLCSFRNVTL